MKIENKEIRLELRDIRKKYNTKMKFVLEAYAEFGDDFVAVDAKVKELHEAEFGPITTDESI